MDDLQRMLSIAVSGRITRVRDIYTDEVIAAQLV
jgi:hypothetical protein